MEAMMAQKTTPLGTINKKTTRMEATKKRRNSSRLTKMKKAKMHHSRLIKRKPRVRSIHYWTRK